MNKVDSLIINAKCKKDRFEDALSDKIASKFKIKERGDSDLLSKIMIMVVVVFLVMLLRWGISYLFYGSATATKNDVAKDSPSGLFGQISEKINGMFGGLTDKTNPQ